MDKLIGKHWHHLAADDVLDLLETNRDKGLDLFEIAARRERFGDNVITAKKGKGPWLRFLLQFHQPLIYILLAAAIITALLQEWVDSGVIFGVVLVNALIGFVQESKAVKAMEALAKTMITEATVIRAGEKKRISSTEVTVGDIVLLQSGDKVPADMRLITARDLRCDESALTGESVPVEKDVDVLPHDTVLADRANMVYGSSLITYGQAAGVVVAIGDHTEVGRISQLISSTEELQPPMLRKIAEFSRKLLYLNLGLARHHPQTAGRGDPGQHHGDLLGQDRDAHREPDDGAGNHGGRRGLRGHRRWLRVCGADHLEGRATSRQSECGVDRNPALRPVMQ